MVSAQSSFLPEIEAGAGCCIYLVCMLWVELHRNYIYTYSMQANCGYPEPVPLYIEVPLKANSLKHASIGSTHRQDKEEGG